MKTVTGFFVALLMLVPSVQAQDKGSFIAYRMVESEPWVLGVRAAEQERLPDDIFRVLQEDRGKFSTPLGDQGAALINMVANDKRLQNYNIGLEKKNGGNNCPLPKSEVRVACDILRIGNRGFDVLSDTEGAGSPQQSESGPATPESFVARTVLEPGGGGGGSEGGGDPPPATTGVATEATQKQVLLALQTQLQQQALEIEILKQMNLSLLQGISELKTQISSGIKIRF